MTTQWKTKIKTALIGILLPACLCLLNPLFAAEALIDSNFSDQLNAEGWPDGWPNTKEASLQEENGNAFLRLESQESGSMVMLYREIHLPEGTEALEFTFKERVSNLKRGSNSWYDARIMMEFMDADRSRVSPNPPTPNRSKNTDGWQVRELKFNVPENARILKFMPSLFRVESGTYDLDDVVLRPIPELAPEDDPAFQRRLKQQQAMNARREKAGQLLEEHGDIFPNGDFERDSNGDGSPDHWGGGTYVKEDGNTFMRINAKPDELAMNYVKKDIPAGVEALELSWRWRIQDLKPGSEAWFDARIMMNTITASGKKASVRPSYSRKSTKGWQDRSMQFLVPEDAVSLEFMPSLFKVKSGILDMDNLSLKPVDPEILLAKQEAAAKQRERMHVDPEEPNMAKWPPMLKTEGNRLVDPSGNEVWLQGVNIASMEWSSTGENVLKSAEMALEEWGANAIRLPVKDVYWLGDKGEAYKTIVDNMITYAANRGAYIVLDLHKYRAPRKEDLAFWKDAATRYKNHPAVLFDLLNEPHGTSWDVWLNGGFIADKEQPADEDAFLTEEEKKHNAKGFMAVGMQAMVDTVREVGANNIVVVGGLDWAYDLSGILNGYAIKEHPNGNGVMYSTHVYPWKSNWQNKFLDVAKVHPILVGEVGADAKKMTWMDADRQEDAETWAPDMMALMQKYRLNYTAWCFHPKASPRMLLDWNYTPTPFWGQIVKDAMSGKTLELQKPYR